MRKLVVVTLALVVAASTLAVAGVHVVGGTKATGNTIPWWGSYTAGRFQCQWHKSEINEAGAVTLIEFQVYSTVGNTFSNVDMLLCHSSRTALTNNYTTNYDGKTPVKVYTGNFVIPANLTRDSWFKQCAPTNFNYNNSDNLLLEISWSGRIRTGANYFWRSSSGQPGRLWASSKTATTGSLYASQGEIARITITPTAVAPTSLGRVKSIFK
ncbi:MAG: hypothetical protein V3T41_02015 [bacterium]